MAAGERSVEEMWNFLFLPSAVDKFVGAATSAIYAAYQKQADLLTAAHTHAHVRCTFISILKLYVTHTACIAKWQPLKHNDYETIIIWRSTRGGPHPKCSLCAVYNGHARAVALISKRNFCSLFLFLSTCLSADLHCFPSRQKECTKKHRECSIACEI